MYCSSSSLKSGKGPACQDLSSPGWKKDTKKIVYSVFWKEVLTVHANFTSWLSPVWMVSYFFLYQLQAGQLLPTLPPLHCIHVIVTKFKTDFLLTLKWPFGKTWRKHLKGWGKIPRNSSTYNLKHAMTCWKWWMSTQNKIFPNLKLILQKGAPSSAYFK